MLELFKIAGRIDLEGADKANKDLDKLDNKGKTTSSKLGGFAKKVGKAGLIAGGAMAGLGTAAFAATKKVTEGFDEIAKASARLGVSTDAYQEFDYWAGQNGIAHAQMEKAVGRFNQRMGMAQNGNEKYAAALQQLGVDMDSVRDGTLSTEDAFAQSIKTLSEMENEQDKVNWATEMFGTKLARDLLPALQDGSLSLEDAKKKAKDLGIVIEEDTLRASEKFNDTWDDLTRMTGAFGKKLLTDLMPSFQKMMDWVIEHLPKIQNFFQNTFDKIGNILSKVRGYVKDAIDWFVRMKDGALDSVGGIEGIFENFAPVFDLFKESAQTLVSSLGPIWESLKELFKSLQPILEIIGVFVGSVLITAFGIFISIVNGVIAAIGPLIDAFINLLDFIVNVVNTVVALFKGDFTGAMEYWERATQASVDFFMSLFEAVINYVSTFVKTIINYFKGLYNTLVGNSIIPDMVNAIINWFKDLGKQAIQLVLNMVKKVVEWFKNLHTNAVDRFNRLRSKATSIFNRIMSAIINPVQRARDRVISFVANMYERAVSNFNNLRSRAKSIFNSVKSAITRPIEKARDIVKSAIDRIKGFFSGLKLKFPKIRMPKLPKFSLKGKFSLAPPSVPKLKVNWNAVGGVFRKPTIFNTANAGLQGVGEAGAEAILPLNKNVLGTIGQSIARTIPKEESGIKELLQELITAVKEGKNIIMDDREVGRIIEPHITENQNRNKKVRGKFA
ncbi:phage tail protein [Virgibacillus sp. W0430]|uniref:phage tail protein n=1 Tax=Virgibacillus sp. W0430 TaxID=3391580 RepID=UPI003F4664B0